MAVGIYSYTFDLSLSRMTFSKVSFSDILGNEYWDHSSLLEVIFSFTLLGFTLVAVLAITKLIALDFFSPKLK